MARSLTPLSLSLVGMAIGAAVCLAVDRKPLHTIVGGVQHRVYLDSAFTYEETTHILEGLLDWTWVTHGAVTFSIERSYGPEPASRCEEGIRVRRTTSDTSLVRRYEKARPPKPGLTVLAFSISECEDRSITLIADRVYGEQIRPVMVHEVGHQLGLDHVTDAPSVMQPVSDNATECLTLSDTTQFCSIYGCDPTPMNHCSAASESAER